MTQHKFSVAFLNMYDKTEHYRQLDVDLALILTFFDAAFMRDVISTFYGVEGGRNLPVSLFEAEKRGRTGDEDVLTSKVFGVLSKVDRMVLDLSLGDAGCEEREE